MASCSPPAQRPSQALEWKTLDSFLEDTHRDDSLADTDRYVSFSLSDLYPAWQEDAHCAGTGHDMYFGNETEQPTMSIKQVRNAAKLCDVCPVFEECLRHALTWREEYGVWAGTSGRTRRRLFALIDRGEASVDELVEVTLNERRETARAIPFRGTGYDTRRDRLVHEEGGPLAL